MSFWRKKLSIWNKTLVKVNNSLSDIFKKVNILENYKTNNHTIVTETKLCQEAKARELEPCHTGGKNKNSNSLVGQQLNFKCPHCKYENISKWSFQKHCNIKHATIYKGSEEPGHECSLCSDQLSTIEKLHDHKADHLEEIESIDVASLTNGNELFQCNICSFESG